MWNYIWPVLLVVGANTFYHICSKSTPDNVQPFATLVVTYLVSAACCLVLFFVTSPEKNLFAAWKMECERWSLGVQHRLGLRAAGHRGTALQGNAPPDPSAGDAALCGRSDLGQPVI